MSPSFSFFKAAISVVALATTSSAHADAGTNSGLSSSIASSGPFNNATTPKFSHTNSGEPSSSVVIPTTSTVYTTEVDTITDCPATVTSCPASSTYVVTRTVSLYTTVCPTGSVVPVVPTSFEYTTEIITVTASTGYGESGTETVIIETLTPSLSASSETLYTTITAGWTGTAVATTVTETPSVPGETTTVIVKTPTKYTTATAGWTGTVVTTVTETPSVPGEATTVILKTPSPIPCTTITVAWTGTETITVTGTPSVPGETVTITVQVPTPTAYTTITTGWTGTETITVTKTPLAVGETTTIIVQTPTTVYTTIPAPWTTFTTASPWPESSPVIIASTEPAIPTTKTVVTLSSAPFGRNTTYTTLWTGTFTTITTGAWSNTTSRINTFNATSSTPSVNITSTVPSFNITSTVPPFNITSTVPALSTTSPATLINITSTTPPFNVTSNQTSSRTTTKPATPSSTGEKFACSKYGYLIQGESNGASLFRVDLASGAVRNVARNVGGYDGINAIGYNVLDDYIYGYAYESSKGYVVRITGNGKTTVIRNFDYSSQDVGDIDASGQYWFGDGGKSWHQVDLNPKSANYGKLVTSGTATVPTDHLVLDWVYLPGHGDYLYTVATIAPKYEEVSVMRFSLTTKEWQIMHTYDLKVKHFGAMYGNDKGTFWASDNENGNIYRFTLGDKPVLASHGPTSNLNDGARCASAAAV